MRDIEGIRELPEKPLPPQRLLITITAEIVNSVLEQQFHVSERDHLVILVHGIRTRALWMSQVQPALQNAGFDVAHTSYGVYGVSRFLLKSDEPRRQAIDRVVKDIRLAWKRHIRTRGFEPIRMSVISHSFGTYVISRILDEERDLKWYRIIFCGSVVRENYRFDRVLDQFHPNLLNEVGTRDFLPSLAESAGWDYGSIGTYGLNNPAVDTRWHRGFRHSSFLTKNFCEKFWIPFLRGNEPIPGDEAPARVPWLMSGIAQLPLRWIVLPSLLYWQVFGAILIPFMILLGAILVPLLILLIWLGVAWWFGWPMVPWRG